MAKSNVLVPLSGTVVVREGKRIRPEIGKAFEYTDDEITSLKNAGAKFRAPQNEEPTEGVAATSTKPAPTASVAEEAQAEAKGGKKKATANKADKDDDL
ncbi:MAG TPA: hypothetical protein VK181_22690 [Rhizobium sp.]|nr:hypothetical protein [Rhizobium sp.]